MTLSFRSLPSAFARATSRPQARRSEAGFTLIETLAVLAIGAMVAAVAVPRLAGNVGLSLQSEAQASVSVLRGARQAALSEGRPVVVHVDLEARTLSAPHLGYFRTFDPDVTLEVTVPRTEQDGQTAQFRFLPDGMSSGGSLRLRQGTGVREITVHWLGGAIAQVN